MIQHTNEEIKEFLAEVFPGIDTHVYQGQAEEPYVSIELENATLSFSQLLRMAEYFDTDKIGDMDFSYSPGCATCDYGSSHTFTLYVYPGKQVNEWRK